MNNTLSAILAIVVALCILVGASCMFAGPVVLAYGLVTVPTLLKIIIGCLTIGVFSALTIAYFD